LASLSAAGGNASAAAHPPAAPGEPRQQRSENQQSTVFTCYFFTSRVVLRHDLQTADNDPDLPASNLFPTVSDPANGSSPHQVMPLRSFSTHG
jgi:hypothetical protein